MLKYKKALEYLPSSTLTVIMDCDIFVTNSAVAISDIWHKWASDSTDLIISRDAHFHIGVPINSGLIIAKPSSFVEDVFGSLLTNERLETSVHASKFNADTLVDQPRLTFELIKRGQLLETPEYETELNEHVSVVSQRVMNAFYRKPDGFFSGAKKDRPESKWREGDWVAHVTGMQPKARVEAAKMFGGGCHGIIDRTQGMVLTTDGKKEVG